MAPAVTKRSNVSDVRAAMHEAVGTPYWSEKGIGSWTVLGKARNEFIRSQLKEMNLTIAYLNSLDENSKGNKIKILEAAFSNDFFSYTRGKPWMCDAIGDDDSWIQVKGISKYMVNAALNSIARDKIDTQEDAGPSTANEPAAEASEVSFFDPVRDSVTPKADQ